MEQSSAKISVERGKKFAQIQSYFIGLRCLWTSFHASVQPNLQEMEYVKQDVIRGKIANIRENSLETYFLPLLLST